MYDPENNGRRGRRRAGAAVLLAAGAVDAIHENELPVAAATLATSIGRSP